jgi:hypothetical protein
MKKYSFHARLAITGPRDAFGLDQFIIGGPIIAHPEQDSLVKSGEWEMLECEIIIIPKKIHRKINPAFKNIRLDHAAQLVSSDKDWSEPEEFKQSKDEEYY